MSTSSLASSPAHSNRSDLKSCLATNPKHSKGKRSPHCHQLGAVGASRGSNCSLATEMGDTAHLSSHGSTRSNSSTKSHSFAQQPPCLSAERPLTTE